MGLTRADVLKLGVSAPLAYLVARVAPAATPTIQMTEGTLGSLESNVPEYELSVAGMYGTTYMHETLMGLKEIPESADDIISLSRFVSFNAPSWADRLEIARRGIGTIFQAPLREGVMPTGWHGVDVLYDLRTSRGL